MLSRLQPSHYDDEGFTLIELTVAMLIVALVLVSLIGLQVSSLKTVSLAKQRQAATALANQKIEKLRSLTYDKIRVGLQSSDAVADAANVSSLRLRAPWDEAVVNSAGQTEPELNPHASSVTVGSVQYSVRAFVTKPKTAAGADSASAVDFWLTVLVSWQSSVTGGTQKSVVMRSRESFPAGCRGSADHPYAGPCQPFLHADAGSTAAGINIRTADLGGAEPLPGLGFQTADVASSSLASGSQTEQTTSAQSTATSAGTVVDEVTASGQFKAQAISDVDPATGAPSAPQSGTMPTTGISPTTFSGSLGSLTLTPSSASSGNAVAAVAAATTPTCQDLVPVTLITGQACASSSYQAASSNMAVLDLETVGGRDLGSMTLGSIAPGSAPNRAFGGRFLTGYATHCSGTTAAGCAAAGVSRSLGDVLAGGLPTPSVGDNTPPAFVGMAKVAGYIDSATSEIGPGSAAIGTASRFTATRAGTLQLWNGSGYTDVILGTLTSSQSYTITPVTAAYVRNGSPTIGIAMTGQVQVDPPSNSKTAPPNCQPEACVGKSSAGSVIASVTYTITSSTSTLAAFTVDVDLGSVLTSTTYRAVPSV